MLSRWFEADPLREATSLRSAMDRLMEQAVVRPGSFLASSQGTVVPPVSVFEHNNQYTMQVYLPGLGPDDVDLTVRQGTVTIKGRWPVREQAKDVTWLLHELGGGEFVRSIALPKQVANDRVEAQFDNGVLTITLPLAAHEQPKSITIKGSKGKTISGSIERNEPKQSELAETASR